MKTIAKIATVASACALAAALTACGGSNSAAPAKSEGSAPVETSAPAAAAATETSAPAEAAATETSAPAEAAATETSAPVAPADAVAYENANFGIGFELPEGWAFQDTSESQAALDSEHPGASIEALAVAPDGTAQFVITVEPFTDATADQDEATHAKNLLTSNQDLEVTETTINLADGRQVPANLVTVEAGDAKVVAVYASMKNDNGFLDMVITAPTEDDINAILSNLKSL